MQYNDPTWPDAAAMPVDDVESATAPDQGFPENVKPSSASALGPKLEQVFGDPRHRTSGSINSESHSPCLFVQRNNQDTITIKDGPLTALGFAYPQIDGNYNMRSQGTDMEIDLNQPVRDLVLDPWPAESMFPGYQTRLNETRSPEPWNPLSAGDQRHNRLHIDDTHVSSLFDRGNIAPPPSDASLVPTSAPISPGLDAETSNSSYSLPDVVVDSQATLVPETPHTSAYPRRGSGVSDVTEYRSAFTYPGWNEHLWVPTAPSWPYSRSPSPARSAHSTVSLSAGNVFVCQYCRTSFTGEYGKGNYQRHVRLKHAGQEKHYPCMTCGRRFKRQDARLKHYRKKHPELGAKPPQSRKE